MMIIIRLFELMGYFLVGASSSGPRKEKGMKSERASYLPIRRNSSHSLSFSHFFWYFFFTFRMTCVMSACAYTSSVCTGNCTVCSV